MGLSALWADPCSWGKTLAYPGRGYTICVTALRYGRWNVAQGHPTTWRATRWRCPLLWGTPTSRTHTGTYQPHPSARAILLMRAQPPREEQPHDGYCATSDRLSAATASRERAASLPTCATSAYAFQRLLHFAREQRCIPPAALQLEHLDAPWVLEFLESLQRVRGNAPRTRNTRG